METLQIETMNLYDLKIASLGYGNMQKGIMNQLFAKNIVDKNKYTAVVNRPKSREILLQEGLAATLDHDVIKEADLVFLAYKQDGFWAEKVHENFAGKIVISIIAGITEEEIAEKFPGAKIVRAMPNRGSVVGEGCTFLKFSTAERGTARDFTAEDKELVKEIFRESGKCYEVQTTNEINQGTILSASMFGIIAFFRDKIHNVLKISRESKKSREFFSELEKIVTDIAQKYQFITDQAEEITSQTFAGVEKLAENSSYSDIQKSVTSKNGTTQAMLENLAENGVDDFVSEIFTDERQLTDEQKKKFAGFLEESYLAGMRRAEELAEGK